jgi:hypothetical protein
MVAEPSAARTTRGRAYLKEPPMSATIARPFTIPTSPEVLVRQVAGLDPGLIGDVTTARRHLEQISPEVLALLREIRALEARTFDVADQIDPNYDRVPEVVGTRELMAAVDKMLAAYPVS